ncbi:MAG: hypothetical protein LBD51_01655 [Bifidobacteriaceae bacterium]|nr:hypothetical protein [Bifidobacteriaceae bacterium]
MERVDLAGNWQLARDGGEPIAGRLPGCTYLDYMAQGMADPFQGLNEAEASQLAHHRYRYSRRFDLPERMLQPERLELVLDGVDTLCAISLNGQVAGRTDNINRVWRLDVKRLCRPGENLIELDFEDPYAAVARLQRGDRLPQPMMPLAGSGHLRKTPSHFGWDWGPQLAPAGVARGIGLEAFDLRVADVRVRQSHHGGQVDLSVTAKCAGLAADAAAVPPALTGALALTSPDGQTMTLAATARGDRLRWDFPVANPQLWWCHGLGGQPLYQLEIAVWLDGAEADRLGRQIGLRTIELDTAPDAHGDQFRFIVNGVPIFAKGANWIPPDSFITRADRDTMFFYARAAKRANMNMLRVWGGGWYENDDFYDACDENGILVWQDFIFACNPYPFYNEDFLANVRAEVEDNVRRLRHRASLALWCGNNETEVFVKMWRFAPKVKQSNPAFYHRTLRAWVDELDGVTPYWPGSPSAGRSDQRPHVMKEGQVRGDTHLWQIWHGMRPVEAFRAYPTRFCSEYGIESMPSLLTVRGLAGQPAPALAGPVLRLHQKCRGGTEKMLFYLLAKHRNPASLEDFVYLTQLAQAQAVGFAAECWRRGIGRHNGALFWQLNDCWPAISWAGIDYGRQLKAVMYQARHFNKMLCLSNDCYADRAELHLVNECPRPVAGRLEWEVRDFYGAAVSRGALDAKVGAVAALRLARLRFADILRGRSPAEVVLQARFVEGEAVRDQKSWLLVADRDAALPPAQISFTCATEAGPAAGAQGGALGIVQLSSQRYARRVYLEADGVTAPWSDNFFDIPAGGAACARVELPAGMDAAELSRRLKVKSLADVRPKNSRRADKWLRAKIFWGHQNYLAWFLFKVVFG